MKLRHLVEGPLQTDRRIIAHFGRGALIRQRNGACQLAGGTPDDYTEAKEWISLFMHDAVLETERPGI
jgi:hypothetical protein